MLSYFCLLMHLVIDILRVKNRKLFSFNPLTDGIQIKAVLMGGGIECPPSKNLENEATESCEGSK